MILAILAFLGGRLKILSPCILPVLPFVFARAEQPFVKSGLPLLVGMALTFAAVATLAAEGGSWAVHINQYGRVIALALMAAFALTLLSRRAADRGRRASSLSCGSSCAAHSAPESRSCTAAITCRPRTPRSATSFCVKFKYFLRPSEFL
jgi:cytochrome c biogenesis protein CcdA